MSGLVDHTGRPVHPVNGGAPAPVEQQMMRQRMLVLQTLGGMLLEAERKALQKPTPEGEANWNPFSNVTMTVKVKPEFSDGTFATVAPGLIGHVAIAGKDFHLVAISCRKVREFLEHERATGNPTPDVGVDPVLVWLRAYEQGRQEEKKEKE